MFKKELGLYEFKIIYEWGNLWFEVIRKYLIKVYNLWWKGNFL
jgi:hypothetical protein